MGQEEQQEVTRHPHQPPRFEDLERQAQVAYILGNFNSMELLGLTRDRAHWEGMQRQATFQRVLEDTKVFKVLLDLYLQLTHDPYIKIYDTTDKVTQKLAGHLALDITSLGKAKRLFRIETDGLAGFSCGAGLMNRRT